MICFIALFVFGVLSIFSAKYRPFFRASTDCVARRLTLRPCDTTLEEQVKSETVAAILPYSGALAKFTNTYWEAITWGFTLLLFASLAYSLFGFYNFIQFGTCDPTNPNQGCVFGDLTGKNPQSLIAPVSLAGYGAGNSSAKVTVVEFGCYACPFTKRAEPAVQQLLSERGTQVNYIFKPFPLPTHAFSREAALGAYCANASGKYLEYRAWLFANQQAFIENGTAALAAGAQSDGINSAQFSTCLSSVEAANSLNASIAEATASKIYLTPTFFINGKPLLGPVQYAELSKAVDDAYANLK